MKKRRGRSPIETTQLGQTREQKNKKRYPNLADFSDNDFVFKGVGNNRHAGGGGGDTADSAAELRFDINRLSPSVQEGLRGLKEKNVTITKTGDIVIYSAEETSYDQNKENAKERLDQAIQKAREEVMLRINKEKRSQGGGKPKSEGVKREERHNREHQSKKKQQRRGNRVH